MKQVVEFFLWMWNWREWLSQQVQKNHGQCFVEAYAGHLERRHYANCEFLIPRKEELRVFLTGSCGPHCSIAADAAAERLSKRIAPP